MRHFFTGKFGTLRKCSSSPFSATALDRERFLMQAQHPALQLHMSWECKDSLEKAEFDKGLVLSLLFSQKKILQEVSEVTPMTCPFLTLFINCDLSCSGFLRSRQNPAFSFPLLSWG